MRGHRPVPPVDVNPRHSIAACATCGGRIERRRKSNDEWHRYLIRTGTSLPMTAENSYWAHVPKERAL